VSGPALPVERGASELDGRRQKIRYLLVGGWNTAFAFCLFAALQIALGDHINYLILLTIATVFAILNAFVCYRAFVFKVTGHFFRDLGRFSTVYIGSYLANLALLPLLVEIVGLPILVAQAALMAATVVGSFFAHRSFSFRRGAPGA
jgi:putative flippase GtrA